MKKLYIKTDEEGVCIMFSFDKKHNDGTFIVLTDYEKILNSDPSSFTIVEQKEITNTKGVIISKQSIQFKDREKYDKYKNNLRSIRDNDLADFDTKLTPKEQEIKQKMFDYNNWIIEIKKDDGKEFERIKAKESEAIKKELEERKKQGEVKEDEPIKEIEIIKKSRQ